MSIARETTNVRSHTIVKRVSRPSYARSYAEPKLWLSRQRSFVDFLELLSIRIPLQQNYSQSKDLFTTISTTPASAKSLLRAEHSQSGCRALRLCRLHLRPHIKCRLPERTQLFARTGCCKLSPTSFSTIRNKE